MPSIGDVIAGKYRLDRLVGEGGMGLVYAATHLDLAQRVAVKFVRADPIDRASATARLVREARAVARLTSEYLARVQDVGVLDDSSPFLVMELLEGETLQHVVRQRGPLSVEQASECGIQVCHALGDAHAHGIVHRDIKPSNLFATFEGAGIARVKVIDFGISKARRVDDEPTAETRTGALMGSPPFMSPEQIRAVSEVDARSDLWSLGVVLYFLVSGKLPFKAQSLLDLMTRITYEEPPLLREVNPEVSQAFADVVARCLRKKPADRYANAAVLAEALSPFAPERARWVTERIARASLPSEADIRANASALADADAPGVATVSQGVSTEADIPVEVGTVDGIDSSAPEGDAVRAWFRQRKGLRVAGGIATGVGAVALVATLAASRVHDATRTSAPSAPASVTPPEALPSSTASASDDLSPPLVAPPPLSASPATSTAPSPSPRVRRGKPIVPATAPAPSRRSTTPVVPNTPD